MNRCDIHETFLNLLNLEPGRENCRKYKIDIWRSLYKIMQKLE